MSPKKTILKTLSETYRSQGPERLVRPNTIPGFDQSPEKYQQTINALLSTRLIEGMKDSEGRMAIALNGQRIVDVEKELRPLWAHPGLLAVLAALALVAAFGVLS
jgi:hypothetical protein